jgi:hypothetical protein
MSDIRTPLPGDDDRELEAFLERRSELSRLYRETPLPAPAELDAAVLAAARAAVLAAPEPVARRPGRLRRWRLPLSLAASLLVGVGVLREVRQDPALQRQVDGEAAAVASVAAVQPTGAPVVAEREATARHRESAGRDEAELRKEKSGQLERRATAAATADARADAMAEVAAAPPAAALADAAPAAARAPSALAAAQPSAGGSAEAKRRPPAAPAPVDEPLPSAAMAAPRAANAISAPSVAAAIATPPWQAARYRDARIGSISGEDWQRLHGAAATEADASPDTRGALSWRLDARQQTVIAVVLQLQPALPLAEVERQEALVGVASQPAPGSCAGAASRWLDYPARGLRLHLDDQRRVLEIRYLATAPEALAEACR